MPSSSKKQHNLMAAVANNPAFAEKAGIPKAVGEEYMSADKGLKFGKGSTTSRADLQKINKPETLHGKMALFAKGGDMATKMNPGFMAMMAKKKDGMAAFEKSGKDVEKKGMKEGSKADMAMDKKQMMGMKKGGMANGGSFRASADGVAQRGKTEARKVMMKSGGKC